MEKMIVDSPAKINLGLNVVGRRTDGYHDLETIFITLLLSDKLTFSKSDELRLNTNSKQLNELNDNLILKAIKLLERQSKRKILAEIFVEKNIPIGGGLGGGSSNAAITLKAINKLFQLGFSFTELSEFALELGSDVPFFLNPVPCFAESRGEILFPLELELSYPILIVNPWIKIDTGWAFSKIKPSKPVTNLRKIIIEKKIDITEYRNYISNDFEEIVFKEYPTIKEIKNELYNQGAKFALMSGTGSTVYGIFTNLQQAYWAEEFFKQKYFTFLNTPFTKGSIT
jgi:4-diphosphocytidyl-2-C-methyl-D-erythritol kinase